MKTFQSFNKFNIKNFKSDLKKKQKIVEKRFFEIIPFPFRCIHFGNHYFQRARNDTFELCWNTCRIFGFCSAAIMLIMWKFENVLIFCKTGYKFFVDSITFGSWLFLFVGSLRGLKISKRRRHGMAIWHGGLLEIALAHRTMNNQQYHNTTIVVRVGLIELCELG